ncbi:23S rRNA (uracil(747)-C(5))-methyltransferase RlmC [Biostraticola tofi]|uniref:23S rRNA (uracil(747)-C(5))-methyltransferase RlmC n=1 Tax=Biostraticola tofi TaxID=466109 RepID=A0A4R3YZW9_9GAMM|nr:23S rRNA (uracil(747)-C(5))-methyltransferase RlmC [Biostraticola tofi]TCV98112.1 23S rRNA m(5)U-747 methyltransferase [Biostraticola tofi]
MHCDLFNAGRCRSCQWLDIPYEQQLLDKQRHLSGLLAFSPVDQWLEPVHSARQSFRNKAKMVVSGSVERPIFGIVSPDGTPADLSNCPLYPASFAAVFAILRQLVARAGLVPYNVARKRGELKFLLLTGSEYTGALMLRFVLRSESKLASLKAQLPWLQQQLPLLSVISVNLQPIHMAILEGETEIILTKQQTLLERLNHVPLHIRPRGFFQTNPAVAARLYAAAASWVAELKVRHLWDLFCGVGGFGLHCAGPDVRLTGIEISPEAIASARLSADEMGLEQIDFQALDSTGFAVSNASVPDLVLVNPPRRGIGDSLCDYLSRMSPRWILYSSCQATTLARDLQALAAYRIRKAQLFDLFPHTAHYETLVLLEHTPD